MLEVIYGKATKAGERIVRGAWKRTQRAPMHSEYAAARYALEATEGMIGEANLAFAAQVVALAKAEKCRFLSAGALLGHLHGSKDLGLSRSEHAYLVRLHADGFGDRWSESSDYREACDEMAGLEEVQESFTIRTPASKALVAA